METEITKKREWLKKIFGNRFDFSVKEKKGIVQGAYVRVDFSGYFVPRKYKNCDEFIVVSIKDNSFIGMTGSMDIIELPFDVVID